MKTIGNVFLGVGKVAQAIAGVSLCTMFLLTLVEVVGRGVWRPVPGAWEITSLLGGIAIGFAVPRTSQRGGHVNVDFVLVKMGKMGLNVTNTVTRLMAIAFFIFAGWGLITMANGYVVSKEVSQTLKIPFYPLGFALGGLFLFQALQFCVDIINLWRNSDE